MRVFSFKNWVHYVNGIQVAGFAKGDGVAEFEFPELATHEMGADGQMVVSQSADKSMKLVLKLQKASKSNAYLMGLASLERNGPTTFVPIVYSAKDSYRTDTVVGANGYITKIPKVSLGSTDGEVEWEFQFERGDMYWADPAFAGLATAVAEAVRLGL